MIRTAAAADFDAIVRVEPRVRAFPESNGPGAPGAPRRLGGAAFVAEAHGEVAAFLLAFRESVDYDSPNYRWFDTRYDRFLYVDRVVVSSRARDAGLGSALYRNVFGKAAADAVPCVVCE
ncbi:MAG: GNAT family N-acetyltransferase, partial [Gammaproteobacteria bacterium]|nr:GNAT family N-acetyltransferase [Gammaproteobacteria bacterium]